MGSPVSVVVADLVMEEVEQRALGSYSSPPKIWKRFVDDSFLIIKRDELDSFFEHINGIENSIKFTVEKEVDGAIPFSDCKISRTPDGKLFSTVYRKPTHSDRYLNFNSDHPLEHKRAVVNTLMHRAAVLSTSAEDEFNEITHIKQALKLNNYPDWILNSKLPNKSANPDKPSKSLAVLPYIPQLGEKIKRVLANHSIKTVFKPPRKIGQLLPSPKDHLDLNFRQGAIYEIPCGDCDLKYIGETKRSFNTRKKEHLKDVTKGDHARTALSKHAVSTSHEIAWNSSKILEFENDYRKRQFIESFYINTQGYTMNDKSSVNFPSVYTTLLNP